nr:pi054 [Schizosaccharomyces pombe]
MLPHLGVMGRPLIESSSNDHVANFNRKTKKLIDQALEHYNGRLPEQLENFSFENFVEVLDTESSVVNRVFEVLVREVAGSFRQRKRAHMPRTNTTAQVVQRQLAPSISTVFSRDSNDPLVDDMDQEYIL